MTDRYRCTVIWKYATEKDFAETLPVLEASPLGLSSQSKHLISQCDIIFMTSRFCVQSLKALGVTLPSHPPFFFTGKSTHDVFKEDFGSNFTCHYPTEDVGLLPALSLARKKVPQKNATAAVLTSQGGLTQENIAKWYATCPNDFQLHNIPIYQVREIEPDLKHIVERLQAGHALELICGSGKVMIATQKAVAKWIPQELQSQVSTIPRYGSAKVSGY